MYPFHSPFWPQVTGKARAIHALPPFPASALLQHCCAALLISVPLCLPAPPRFPQYAPCLGHEQQGFSIKGTVHLGHKADYNHAMLFPYMLPHRS